MIFVDTLSWSLGQWGQTANKLTAFKEQMHHRKIQNLVRTPLSSAVRTSLVRRPSAPLLSAVRTLLP